MIYGKVDNNGRASFPAGKNQAFFLVIPVYQRKLITEMCFE